VRWLFSYELLFFLASALGLMQVKAEAEIKVKKSAFFMGVCSLYWLLLSR